MSYDEKKKDDTGVVLENVVTHEEFTKPGPKLDYSGAVVELNPIEKKLVKKLDYRIMVSKVKSDRFELY